MPLHAVERVHGPGGRIVERDVLGYVESQPKATPMARKVAADLGIDLATVTGTGVGGKITQQDVEAATRPAPPAERPVPAAVPVLPTEVAASAPMSGLRRIIADRMSTSAHTTARVTNGPPAGHGSSGGFDHVAWIS